MLFLLFFFLSPRECSLLSVPVHAASSALVFQSCAVTLDMQQVAKTYLAVLFSVIPTMINWR